MSEASPDECTFGGMTAEQCSQRAIISDTPDSIQVALWHPQLGGYVGMAKVQISKVTSNTEGEPGCFDVENYHDGDFPSETPTHAHYCDAVQLLRFGLDVLEKQAEHQRQQDGQRLKWPKGLAQVQEDLERIRALFAETRDNPTPVRSASAGQKI